MNWNSPEAIAYNRRDYIAKLLEIEAIAKYVKDGMSVLDVGCGDGETILELLRRFPKLNTCCGIDASPTMIAAARARQYEPEGVSIRSRVAFRVNDLTQPWPQDLYDYDLIYTERCLINLPDWETQKKAIGNIAKALKPGGLYVMLENSWDGLQFINDLREKLGLYRIEPPIHNRYLRDAEVDYYAKEAGMGLVPEEVDDYSSTYYFLSRVINAALAAQEGREPAYDSPINKLALSLPPISGLRGQGRIWIWRAT